MNNKAINKLNLIGVIITIILWLYFISMIVVGICTYQDGIPIWVIITGVISILISFSYSIFLGFKDAHHSNDHIRRVNE